jgi:hypothetical protein
MIKPIELKGGWLIGVHLNPGAKGGKTGANHKRGFADEEDTRADETRVGEESQ